MGWDRTTGAAIVKDIDFDILKGRLDRKDFGFFVTVTYGSNENMMLCWPIL